MRGEVKTEHDTISESEKSSSFINKVGKMRNRAEGALWSEKKHLWPDFLFNQGLTVALPNRSSFEIG